MTLRLNLGQYLKEHGISAYRLVQEVQGSVAPNTVYALARKPAQRIDLGSVAKILQALARVRGEQVQITDMLEDLPEPDLTLLQLQSKPLSPAPFKAFRYSGPGERVQLPSGTVARLISEGRDP